jgi:membrane-bound inhibitor of C-type lysozyme
MRPLPALAAVAAFAAAPAAADGVAEGLSVSYRCAGGAALQAAYLNAPDGTSYAVVLHAGRLVPMKAGPTGSGVRYLSLAGPPLVWHTKGDAGFLARDDAGETMLLDDCHAVDP